MEADIDTFKPHVERRRFPRLNCHSAIQFRNVLKPQEQFNGTLSKDLSAGGLCMTTDVFFPKESRLVLLLSLPGILKSIRLICRVMWTQQQRFADGYECGAEFVEVAPEDRQEIVDYIRSAQRLSSYTETNSLTA